MRMTPMTSFKAQVALSSALCVLLLAGCGILKKKQPQPEASATAAPLAPPPAAPAAPAAPAEPEANVADDAIPTPEDFEEEALERVTDKTYKSELATLKKEIEAK